MMKNQVMILIGINRRGRMLFELYLLLKVKITLKSTNYIKEISKQLWF
jgi:hypothetical protein